MPLELGARPALGSTEFDGFRTLVRQAAGIHLSDAKHDLVASRLARRLRHLGLASYREYYELVRREDPDGPELREMVNCITTNKTSFFRESHHFVTLGEMLQQAETTPGAPIRIWSAGCSTGEEPYTIALTAIDTLGPQRAKRVGVYATDIDTNVLDRAELGVYAERSLADVPERLRRLGFLRGVSSQDGRVRVRPEVHSLVQFAPFNLNDPAAWRRHERFDAIFCRNVIIYFDGPTRTALLERFAEHLKPNGLLFLGHSEGLHASQSVFEPVGRTTFRLRSRARSDGVPRAGFGRTVTSAAARPTDPLVPSRSQPPVDRVLGVGEIAAERGPVWIRTLLGSCVAACLFDPQAGVGGMNHFLLPTGDHPGEAPTRYGVHAMELLINEIMRRGGDRRRIKAKLFGGASVLGFDRQVAIPKANVEFARHFLELEGIPLVSEHLGGQRPLDVRMEASTGRVLVRAVGIDRARPTLEAERRYQREFWRSHPDGSSPVTFF